MAADVLLEATIDLVTVGQTGTDALQPLVEAVKPSASTQGGNKRVISESLFAGLVAARPHFGHAEQQLGRVYEEVAGLSASHLWSPLDTAVTILERYLQLGQAALGAAAAAPALLGESGPVQYLILAQNADELRATGGFISGIGLLSVERGRIGQPVFKDSYAVDKFTVDHPFAPEPMQRHMGIILWTTRDGNWSPDYPTAAQAVEDLYHLENSGDIAGVIAVDMEALSAMVAAVGPLELEGEQDLITADNMLQKVREYWAPGLSEDVDWEEWRGEDKRTREYGKWFQHRKDFMAVFARALMSKLQRQGGIDQLYDLARATKKMIDEKHIQLYFHEAAVQELLDKARMDGALGHGADGDYLLVLDTNMGYNKVNANVEKQVAYEVVLARDSRPSATVTVTYVNHSPPQPTCDHGSKHRREYELMTQDCYWNYLRLYVPLGAELVGAEGVAEIDVLGEESGKSVFGTFLVVPAHESRKVQFTYRLPQLSTLHYTLLVQKQAGTDAVSLSVRVALPSGTKVLSAEPAPSSRQQSVVSYDWNLRRDRSFALRLR